LIPAILHTVIAKPSHLAPKHKPQTVNYILHGAMQDNGPGTGGTEDYTIYSYLTTSTDTAYSARITVTGSTFIIYWDGSGDGFHADISVGSNYGMYSIPNYLPPHSTFPVSFTNVTFPSTYNGGTVTLDPNVIYFTTYP
jgi:hypothetical protein